MVALNCKESYLDIFSPVPPNEDPHSGPTAQENRRRKILYLAVRKLLRDNFSFDIDDSTTLRPEDFPSGFGKRGKSAGAKVWDDLLREEKIMFSSVYGILLSRNYTDPSLGKLAIGLPGPDDEVFVADGETVFIVDRFVEATTEAVKRYNANRSLFGKVFEVLLMEGAILADDGSPISTTLQTRQLADVTSRLIDDRVSADHPQLRRLVINALSQMLGGFIGGSASDFDVSLPDLEAGTAIDIIASNVRAVAAIYFSAMLEEMKLYAVTEKIAEHFMIGMVPLSRGPAGDRIYSWIKKAPERFTEIERRSVYGRVLGVAQGSLTDVLPNREFMDLWLRALSTESVFFRDAFGVSGTGTTQYQRVTKEQAHKAWRDLSVNLSLHGYGIAHPAAIEMQGLVTEMKDMLSSAELLTAYGVNDVWQLVDRVSGMYLGGTVNGVRYRTMAQAGAAIVLWLADHAPLLSSVSLEDPQLFLDSTLVRNVDRWLAVTGTAEQAVEKNTDPVDLKTQPTIPAFAPTNGASSATAGIRQALQQAGIGNLPGIPV